MPTKAPKSWGNDPFNAGLQLSPVLGGLGTVKLLEPEDAKLYSRIVDALSQLAALKNPQQVERTYNDLRGVQQGMEAYTKGMSENTFSTPLRLDKEIRSGISGNWDNHAEWLINEKDKVEELLKRIPEILQRSKYK